MIPTRTRKILAIGALSVAALTSQTQIQRCGSGDRYISLMASAEFRAGMESLEGASRNEYGLLNTQGLKKLPQVTIPVLVHVLYNGEMSPENGYISDRQIDSQITVLNRDYNPTDQDRDSIPLRFRGRFGYPKVHFELAKVDRMKSARRVFSIVGDTAKHATDGEPPISPDKYLNIWVVPGLIDHRGLALFGYSSFPKERAEVDGVVIVHTAFGTTGTAKTPYNAGRTATHEIGHWLNLHHLWGDHDGNPSCTKEEDDLVDDTPRQKYSHMQCPPERPLPLSCPNEPTGDMYMNYMDYPPDSCMSMFTVGQVARMRATLKNVRTGFKTALEQ